MFEIKKIIGGLLMPLPLTLIILSLCLLFIAKQNKKSYLLAWLCVLATWFISTPYGANLLIEPVEKTQVPFDVKKHKKLDYIVVLGCDVYANSRLPANGQLGGCALSRLVEGLRLVNAYPQAKLIVSGYGFGNTTGADLMAETAKSLGIAKHRISTNPTAKDTADEAKLLAPKLVDRKVALVTSASHMARASDLFYVQGVDVIKAPVQFYTYKNTPAHKLFIPDSGVLRAVTSHWHEVIGKTWIALRRLINPEAL